MSDAVTEPTDKTSPPPPPERSRGQAWRENLQLIAIALVLSVLVRGFVAEPRYIPSDSMFPTLTVSDRLVIDKISHWVRPYQRGDILVFQPPPQLQDLGYRPNQAFIKRVIGLPGQTVEVHDGAVYVDGQPLAEPYIAAAPAYTWGPATVPEGDLFVMGDNRNNSNDSHVWGFLPIKNAIGRAWLRFWPLDRLGRVDHI